MGYAGDQCRTGCVGCLIDFAGVQQGACRTKSICVASPNECCGNSDSDEKLREGLTSSGRTGRRLSSLPSLSRIGVDRHVQIAGGIVPGVFEINRHIYHQRVAIIRNQCSKVDTAQAQQPADAAARRIRSRENAQHSTQAPHVMHRSSQKTSE